jgi:uncharacterized repeat protein (TIGR02543 family)
MVAAMFFAAMPQNAYAEEGAGQPAEDLVTAAEDAVIPPAEDVVTPIGEDIVIPATEPESTEVVTALGDDGTTNYDFIVPVTHKTSVPDGYTGITTPAELAAITAGGQYILMNNIDLSGYNGGEWIPIGTDEPFYGILNGNGYVISNMHVNIESSSSAFGGLIGCAGVSTELLISNIGIENSNVQVSVSSSSLQQSFAGGLVGYCEDSVVIENSYNAGGVTSSSSPSSLSPSYSYAGGLVGFSYTSSSLVIENSYNTGEVISSSSSSSYSSYSYAGGLVSFSYTSSLVIENSYNTGEVTSSSSSYSYAGGLIGSSDDSSFLTIKNCYNTGEVMSYSYYNFSSAGGLVGSSGDSSFLAIENSYNTGEVTSSSSSSDSYYNSSAGGLVGSFDDSSFLAIENSYNTGEVTSSSSFSSAGGLVGYFESYSSSFVIENSYNTGEVTSSSSSWSYAGGLVGSYESSSLVIENSYNTGEVTSSAYTSCAGGLVGLLDSVFLEIENSYNAGMVTSSGDSDSAKGLFGGSANSKVENCYYIDSATAASYYDYLFVNVSALSDTQMRQQESFIGFDFVDVWEMPSGGGYPVLQMRTHDEVIAFPSHDIFPSMRADYGAQQQRQITIVNFGTSPLTNLVASFGGNSRFEISTALSQTTVAAKGMATVSVRPKLGSAAGIHSDVLTISGDNGLNLTIPLSFTVTAHTYKASFGDDEAGFGIDEVYFLSAELGYGERTAEQITIKNTGTGQLTGLTAALGENSKFEITAALSKTTIAVGGTANIKVRPVTGLLAGIHSDVLTISGDNGLSLSIPLSFTVNGPRTVTFSGNGSGAVAPQSIIVDYGAEVGELQTATRAGFVFEGWWTTATGGTEVTPSTLVTANVTYYAHWTAISGPSAYQVVFVANDGSSAVTRTVNAGAAVGQLPEPARAGYTFDGWYTEASGGVKISALTLVTATVVYYAHWTAVKVTPPSTTYKVTFDANGGTSVAGKSVSKGAAIGALPKTTRTGYTFKGWYTAASGGTKVTDKTKPAGDVTYFAQWIAKTYTVTHNVNGGNEISAKTKTVKFGSAYGKLASTSRAGYTFKGWYTAKSGGTQITKTTKVQIAKNHTLHAQWTAKTFTATFNANGGKVSPVDGGAKAKTTKLKVTYAAKFGALPTPTRTGYKFDGWYTDKSGGTKITKTTVVKITKNTTYYARWTKK